MKRRVESQLTEWKANRKKPLMVLGPRQIGKTTSIVEFGKREFDALVHIDFYRQPQLAAAFSGNLEPQTVIIILEALLGLDIEPNATLLFLDEIQVCPQAITALKYFCIDMPQLAVVAAGSLLGVHLHRSGSFPVGYVDMLNMHPMDFQEFCWAMGEERSLVIAEASYKAMSQCPLHDHLIDLYREYLLVGGMPEAVALYTRNRSLVQVRQVQDNICTAYVADMSKYAEGIDAGKIVSCWESVPAQLAKPGEDQSTKFMWKHVASGAKAERFGTALDWLVSSGVVTKCVQVTDGVSPLKSFEKPNNFKIYLADTGLLSSLYEATPIDIDPKDNRRNAHFRGGMAENYVMQQLTAYGVNGRYWGVQSTNEVEFVVQAYGGICPIEVKSGSNVKRASAEWFAKKYESPCVFRVTAKNFGGNEGVRNIPLYAAHLLARDIANNLAN